MQLTALVLLAASTLVAGQHAKVKNDCTHPAYVQSVPYDGSAPGPLTTLQPGGTFSEAYRASGSTVKMGTLPGLRSPLEFGYSLSNNPYQVYYELKNNFGNPFSASRNRIDASRAGCPHLDCAANDSGCYSSKSDQKVQACNRPADVTVTLCAPN